MSPAADESVLQPDISEAAAQLHAGTAGTVHVWSVPLSRRALIDLDWAALSVSETDRARRFHFERHRKGYVLAHVALRQILSAYTFGSFEQVEFVITDAGKPSIDPAMNSRGVEFNLSHSGDFALVAVTRGAAIGVDIEQWDSRVEFLHLAEHFFSSHERAALRELAESPLTLMQGFFQAWSRKEAYLKATGAGITKGLHHFDVSLAPGATAELLIDRNDPTATTKWSMADLAIADGYSAAVVAAAPLHNVVLSEFSWT